MQIEVWSDVVCVWCYLGTRRLEKALAQFEQADQVEVVWRSFQLDPSHPKGVPQPAPVAVAKKMGASADQVRTMADQLKAQAAQEGLAYDFDRSILVNTFDAHRLTHLAKAHGLDGEVHRRLMHAHFVDGETVDDTETLVRIGAEAGIPVREARRVLTGDEYAKDVDDDIHQAGLLGVTSVPTLVLDRVYRVSGAQSVEELLSTLRTAHHHRV